MAAGVVAGVSYKAGVDLEVESRVDGTFRAAVVWYDAAGAVVSESEIANRTAVGPRSRSEITVTAPAGAVRAGTKFEWTGAVAGGTAYADTFTVVPAGLAVKLKDLPGACNNLTAWPPTTGQCGTAAPAWGKQRIIDFSGANPVEIGSYSSPNSRVWPPPDNGIYAPPPVVAPGPVDRHRGGVPGVAPVVGTPGPPAPGGGEHQALGSDLAQAGGDQAGQIHTFSRPRAVQFGHELTVELAHRLQLLALPGHLFAEVERSLFESDEVFLESGRDWSRTRPLTCGLMV